MAKKIALHTLTDTQNLASKIVGNLQSSKILALQGDLGAGKTTFAQALGRALNIKRAIKSPTFTMMQTYAVKKHPFLKTLCHVDAYRVSTARELEALGLFDYFNDPTCLTVIEWANLISDSLPSNTTWLEFYNTDDKRWVIIK